MGCEESINLYCFSFDLRKNGVPQFEVHAVI